MNGRHTSRWNLAPCILALGVALALTGCFGGGSSGGSSNDIELPDDDGFEDEVTEPSPEVTELQVTASETTVVEGRKVELTATALYDDDTQENVTDQAEWTVEDGAGDAAVQVRVDDDDRVFAEGKRAGQSANVSAEFSGRFGGVSIDVVSPELTSLRITPSEPAPLPIGTSLQLSAQGEFETGVTADVSGEVTWSVADTHIATISENGELEAEGKGQTEVHATFDDQPDGVDDVTEKLPIEVTDATVEDLSIHEGDCETGKVNTLHIDRSAVVDLRACASYSDDSTATVTEQAEWALDGEDTARIESIGGTPAVATISGRSQGNTQLTVTFDGAEASATLQIANAADKPASLSLRAQPNVILAGADDETRIRATVTPNDPEATIARSFPIDLTASPEDVLDDVPTDLETGGAGDNARAEFTTTATADTSRVVTLRGRVPGTLAESSIQIRVVEDFARIFARAGLINEEIDALALVVQNTSNRAFDVEGFDVFKAGELDGSFGPESLRQTEIEPGGPGIQVVDFPRGLDLDDDITLQFRLHEPVTGTSFTVAVNFF